MGRFLCSFYVSRTQRLYLCVGSTAPSIDILLFAIDLIDDDCALLVNYRILHMTDTDDTTTTILVVGQLSSWDETVVPFYLPVLLY